MSKQRSDWVPRNFYRRVEVMFPIEGGPLRKRILREIIPAYQRDNVCARELSSEGAYRHVEATEEDAKHRCQLELLQRGFDRVEDVSIAREITVQNRSPNIRADNEATTDLAAACQE